MKKRDLERLMGNGVHFPFVYMEDAPLLRPLVLVSAAELETL
jgi:hypothetical protein